MHGYILAVYALIVGLMLFMITQRVLALSDLTNNFNFSVASDYTYDSGIEVTGNSARFKALNYSDDASTAALFHFDEVNGSVANDSSSNNNDGAVTNATFGSGNLNNALSFNGSTSSLSVPDSPTLSLSQKNSIESWTKLNNSFSAGSEQQRQSIVDKGDYQLYYDNETGKVVYELADKNANSWALSGGNDVNGGWDTNGKRSVNAQVKVGSDIYVGIGVDTGDAEVWKWNGTAWSKIGGGINKVNDSWDGNTYEGVYSLATDGTNVYAGLGTGAGDADVFKWNGTAWSKIGGDGINSGWLGGTYEQVWSMDYYGSNLYAAIGTSANDAEVWKWNGTAWSKIGGDGVNSGWTTNYEMTSTLTNDGTNLYAGLGNTAGDAEVWKWNGTAWSKIGGDAINSGWDATIETVRALNYYGGSLYAGVGDSAGDADVWKWNGRT